ncbi:hypothetical protein IT568_11205, partial [bacterium]|nr:hypothetical protein [bacterium]
MFGKKLILSLLLNLILTVFAFSQTVVSNLGLYGCTGNDVLVDANGVVYLSVDGPQSVYISTNHGSTWTGGLATTSTYLGGGKGLAAFVDSVYLVTDNGILRTVNAGASWTPILEPSSGLSFYNQIGVNQNTHDIFVGSMNGNIYYSSDKGSSWSTQTVTGTPGNVILKIAFDENDYTHVFTVCQTGGTNGYLYESTNTGTSYAKLTVTDPTTLLEVEDIYNVGIHPTSADTIYAGTFDMKLYKSTDAGANWEQLTAYQAMYGLPNIGFKNDTLYVSGYRSLDNGQTFTELTATFGTHTQHIDSKGWAYDETDDHYFYAFGALGIFVSSDNGTTYVGSNTGIEGVQVQKMSQISTQKDTVWVATQSGLAKATNFTTTPVWDFPVDVGWDVSGHECVEIDPSNTDNVYSANSRIHQTQNFGTSWSVVYDEGLPLATQQKFTEILCVPDSDPTVSTQVVLASMVSQDGTTGKIIRSDDGGTTWSTVLSSVPVNTLAINSVSGVLFAGVGDKQQNTVQGGIYKSTDNGLTWSQIVPAAGVSLTGYVVTHIEFHPVFPNLMFASCGANNINGSILRSLTFGNTWTDISPTTPEVGYFASTLVDLTSTYLLYACINNKVYTKNYYTASWTLTYEGLTGETINFLFYDGLVMGTTTGF